MKKTGSLLIIQDYTGDTKFELSWDPNNKEEVKQVRETFFDLMKEGYIFFECKRTLGIFKREGKQVEQFDPSYKKLFFKKSKFFDIQQNDDAEAKTSGEFEWYDPSKDEPKPDKQYTAAKMPVGG